jgi:UDP-N-acetylmuramyl pentapeptide phosphotransferase/UDP-N-acetylglucosamine-1-phosphate transferase
MTWLPLALSALMAAALAPPMLAMLERAGVVRENYRGLVVPAAGGTVIAAAAIVALGPLALLDEITDGDVLRPVLGDALVYVLGVGVLGLLDDLLGGRVPAGAAQRADAPRGWRGHARAAAHGRFSTGALKAVGALGLALYVMSGSGRSASEYAVGVGLLLLATNLFNLLDLRPGRAGKVFVALGMVLTLGSWDTWALETLGLFIGPALVLLPLDLGERVMLGDVGSNVLGGIAGIWLIFALGPTGEAVALAVLAAITLYAEFRSISALVERNPLMRRLDSLGRKNSGISLARNPGSSDGTTFDAT